MIRIITITTILLAISNMGFADPVFVRWTGVDDSSGDFNAIVKKVAEQSGLLLTPADFLLVEDTPLSNYRFRMYSQMAAGFPRDRLSIRIWTSKETGNAVQVEALVDGPIPSLLTLSWSGKNVLSSELTMARVREFVRRQKEDRAIRGIEWRDVWQGKDLIRVVTIQAKRGKHKVLLSAASGKVLASTYEEYPRGELSFPAQVYSLFEEMEGASKIQDRVTAEIRHLNDTVTRITSDPYVSLKAKRYFEDKFNPVLGLLDPGIQQGYWSMSAIKSEAARLIDALPKSANSFDAGGVILDGKFATISFVAAAEQAFPNLSFKPSLAPHFRPEWLPTPEDPEKFEMIPSSGLRGRPLASVSDAFDRPARRLPDHNPAEYINDGFDEIQVYWAVNQLFESLRPMGFDDPELSTRPFHAFLYDPDISFRDNAFYTDDTINFTTYSPNSPNMARDNTTIWHELGHGVMDRMMGDDIKLADTGGLSEGMADFVAQLVINDVTGGAEFDGKYAMRIFNNTGFNLTNEVHDDGEAYGGAMNDLLVKMIEKEGRTGLHKVTDLTLNAMRLARNHPGLTANDWFGRMLFADELGNVPLRQPGELRADLLAALAGRNFAFASEKVANFSVKYSGNEVSASALGSRNRPIPVKLAPNEVASFPVRLKLESGDAYAFQYPVRVQVEFNQGPLQGAAHWGAEELGYLVYNLASEDQTVEVPLQVTGICDEVNRPDGSCVDYAYIKVWSNGAVGKPSAKKRFYLRVYPQK